MTILFEAWRRAHGKDPRLAETLGAPVAALRERSSLLPWVLCLLLAACLAGLGIYIWLDWASAHGSAAKASPPLAAKRAASASRLSETQLRPSGAGARVNRGTHVAGSSASASPHTSQPAVAHAAQPPAVKPAEKPAGQVVRNTAGESAAGTSAGRVSRAPAAATLPLAEVPADVREAMPSLVVVAHVWNANPDARFIMVGGRLYRTGDELAPGLRLLAITQEGEVVSFRGYHISLP